MGEGSWEWEEAGRPMAQGVSGGAVPVVSSGAGGDSADGKSAQQPLLYDLLGPHIGVVVHTHRWPVHPQALG